MIDNPYKDSIAQQIVAKQVEIEFLKKEAKRFTILQKIQAKTQMDKLEEEIDTLIHLLNEEETVPTKEDILVLIDVSLDERNEEEFMKLTSLLKTMKKD